MKKTKKQEELKFYSLNKILETHSDYNIIFGERSNGKTYAVLEHILTEYVKYGKQGAYIRRWREDLRGKRGETLFANHVANGFISKITNNVFNAVTFNGGKYYLTNTEENKKDTQPFCYAFSLSEQEHEKSSSYPNIKNIVFDEFLTRRYYLPDEFMLFMNLLSTLIRQKNDIQIFMLGNTVNKYCPYFSEFGLKNITTMQQGTIDVYKFGKGGLQIAVEYAASVNINKPSNKYFCFDNENLQMITNGAWQLDIYPHLPTKYLPKDVVFVFYIEFENVILQCNVISKNNENFIFIHYKTTPIKDTANSLIYSLNACGQSNYKKRLLSNYSEIERKITNYFATDKVFFQSNEIGEIVRNYIKISSQNNLIK